MHIYPRKILEELKEQIHSKEAVVLTGMRRIGKTTVLREIYKLIEGGNKAFLDLENPITQKIFEEKDYENILINLKEYGIKNQEKAYVFIDEIQAMPNIVRAVKYLIDHYGVKFFLTGSSSYYLKNMFPESLAGRKVSFEMYPLDFEEFLWFKGVNKKFTGNLSEKEKGRNEISYEKTKKYYEEYMAFGGFPQVVLSESGKQKKYYLEDIFKSYFEKDVAVMADFKNIATFRDLILLLMQRAGSKLEISKLSSEIGVSRETVYSYLSFLQGTYFLFLAMPYSKSVDREISGSKKTYICDCGILNHLAKVSEGALFENAVYLNLKKYGKINYYQTRSGAEIDFVVPKESAAVEAKMFGSEREYEKLKQTAKSIGMKHSYIVTKKFVDKKGFIPAQDL